MNFLDLLRLVATNLGRARFRAALSASGVLIGTGAVVILISVAAGLQGFTTQNLSTIGPLNEITVNRRGGFGGNNQFIVGLNEQDVKALTPQYLQDLAKSPGVAAVTPLGRLSSTTVKSSQLQSGATVYGIDPAALPDFDLPFASGSLDLGRGKVFVGSNVGSTFTDPRKPRGNLADPIDLQGKTLTIRITRNTSTGQQSVRQVQVRVTGVLAARGSQYDNNVFIQLSDYEELQAWQSGKRANRRVDGYTQALVLASDPSKVNDITTQLQNDGFFAFSSQAIVDRLNSTFSVLQGFVGAVGVIALAIAGTGIANTLITAIYERTREIGLMKAVGATDDQVMAVFLAEAGAIGGLGGLGGTLLGWLVALAANVLVQQYYLPTLTASSGGTTTSTAASGTLIAAPAWLLIGVPFFAVFMGVAAGWYPARRAASLDPVVALRSE
jgi:putative ABC transport system permease protein